MILDGVGRKLLYWMVLHDVKSETGWDEMGWDGDGDSVTEPSSAIRAIRNRHHGR